MPPFPLSAAALAGLAGSQRAAFPPTATSPRGWRGALGFLPEAR
jgi:hypothetical protein